jgi:O-antigen biosynthesis protein
VAVCVCLDGDVVGRAAADRFRSDLPETAGAFEFWFSAPPREDAATEIAVRAEDGAHLPGSPVRLDPVAPPPGSPRLPDVGAPLALVVDAAAPDASRDAASVALLSHMQAVRGLGFSVVFAPLAEAEAAIRQHAGRVRLAYLHRLRPMALLAARVRAANPGVHVVFAVADLAHLRAEREAALTGTIPPAGLRAAEFRAARAADAVLTHSAVEAELLTRALPGVRAHVVPWAVPPRPVAVPFADRAGIGFLGSFGHPPNPDAVRVLLDEIMPALWAEAPVPCVLAGSGMPRWMRERAGRLIQVIESLPDTAALWRRVRVSVAPLRFGAGVKGKVLDSLAAGIPCVCSPVAAEGLFLPPSLIAADRPAMVAALLRLHADAEENAQAAADGFAVLALRHTPDAVARALARALAPG